MADYDPDVIALKPDMILTPSPISPEWKNTNIRLDDATVQAKGDGEFNAVFYNKDGETYTKNKYGRKETAQTVPAIKDFVQIMAAHPIKKAVFLVEMFVMNPKPMRVCDFIHYLKGSDKSLRQFICLGFFDMVSIDGVKVGQSHTWRLEEMERILGFGKKTSSKRIRVFPWQHVKTKRDVELAWKEYKEVMGYEGLVIRNGFGQTFKLKPEMELDAVWIGVNKNDGYYKNLGTSLRLAVMVDKNTFLEIGDVASGIEHKLRELLWAFKKDFTVLDTNKISYVQPEVVMKIQFNDMWQKPMQCWKWDGTTFHDAGKRLSITMRHPKLIEIRTDKTVISKDVGLNQIPRGRFDKENYGQIMGDINGD